MGSETMGLKGVNKPIRTALAQPHSGIGPETKETHSWDEEESFFASSLRSESVPKSKGPSSF